MDDAGDGLTLLVPFSRDHQNVARPERVQPRLDRLRPVPDLRRPWAAAQDVGPDRSRVLAPGIVVGDDDPVRQSRRRLAHQGTLAAVAVSAGAEHDVKLARGVRTKGGQQPLQRVGRVGVIDISGGAVRQPRRQFHPAAHTGQARHQVQHVLHPQDEGQTRGHQHIVRLEPARQVQPYGPKRAFQRDLQILPVRTRRRRHQPEQGPAGAHGVK